jgi:pimeloyl-ACP methyl ester carboxylesterase
MPFAGITQDVVFKAAPLPADKTNNKVAVHLSATFDTSAPFVLCVFMHGLGGDGSIEDHIQTAIAQIASSSTNTLLVAPRFGNGSDPGAFQDIAGFSSFVAELRTILPSLPTPAGVADYAAAKAPIVLVGFSGGWRPLNTVLNGLLALGEADPVARRIAGIVLLDSIYGPISSAGVIAWQRRRRAQTALLSIYGRNTAQDARASNLALIDTLKTTGPVLMPASWSELKDFPPGTVAFLEVTTPHLSIPADGPPVTPIASFLSLLGDRIASPPSV